MSGKATISDLEKRIREPEGFLANYQSVEEERLMILEVLELVNAIDSAGDLLRLFIGWMKKWSGCEAVGIRLREGEDFPYYETSGFPSHFVNLENSLCVYDKGGGNMLRDRSEGEPDGGATFHFTLPPFKGEFAES